VIIELPPHLFCCTKIVSFLIPTNIFTTFFKNIFPLNFKELSIRRGLTCNMGIAAILARPASISRHLSRENLYFNLTDCRQFQNRQGNTYRCKAFLQAAFAVRLPASVFIQDFPFGLPRFSR